MEPKRRRIPVAQLREILKAQGNPWADELGDVAEAVEKRLPAIKSPKHRESLETALTKLSETVSVPPPGLQWDLIIGSLRATLAAKRPTLAIKHAEKVLTELRGEQDDEEALVLLMYG